MFMFVCLCDHIFGTTRPIFNKICAHGRGSVLLWRRSDTMICTSGSLDEIIFAHKPRLLDVAAS